MLGLSCALQKNVRLLVLNPPSEGEGNIRLGELGFCLQLLALYFFFPLLDTRHAFLSWNGSGACTCSGVQSNGSSSCKQCTLSQLTSERSLGHVTWD